MVIAWAEETPAIRPRAMRKVFIANLQKDTISLLARKSSLFKTKDIIHHCRDVNSRSINYDRIRDGICHAEIIQRLKCVNIKFIDLSRIGSQDDRIIKNNGRRENFLV